MDEVEMGKSDNVKIEDVSINLDITYPCRQAISEFLKNHLCYDLMPTVRIHDIYMMLTINCPI